MTVTTIPTAGIADNAVTAAKASGLGKVLQVVSTTKTDSFSATAGGGAGGSGFVDVTGMSVNITPSSTSSKIYVHTNLNVATLSGSDYEVSNMINIVRDSTNVFVGTDASGSQTNAGSYTTDHDSDVRNMHNVTSSGLDSPNTTSQVTYKVQMSQGYNIGGRTIYVNRNASTGDSYSTVRTASTITVMEVSA